MAEQIKSTGFMDMVTKVSYLTRLFHALNTSAGINSRRDDFQNQNALMFVFDEGGNPKLTPNAGVRFRTNYTIMYYWLNDSGDEETLESYVSCLRCGLELASDEQCECSR